MELHFQTGALLLLIAAVVAMLARRLHLPYSVSLVAAGIFLAVLPFGPQVSLTKDLLFTGLLPPLLFEAAFSIHWSQLRRDLSVIVVLATLGVVLSAVVTGLGMRYLAHWQWLSALAFGILIAATDPVSVIATFKEAKAQGRLLVLVEAESLFNDGTAAVAFGVVVAMASGERAMSLGITARLLTTIGGGLLCGVPSVLERCCYPDEPTITSLKLRSRPSPRTARSSLRTISACPAYWLRSPLGWSWAISSLSAGSPTEERKPFRHFGNTAPSLRTRSCFSSSACTKPINISWRFGFPWLSRLRWSRLAGRSRSIPAALCFHALRFASP